jgi:DNA-binding YbaB/EbfC family protein
MGNSFAKIKKQAKQFEDQFSKIQQELQAKEIHGEAGSGLVKVILSGDKKLKRVKINPECVDIQDLAALEDLIIGAFEDAEKKLEESTRSLGSGLGLPF